MTKRRARPGSSSRSKPTSQGRSSVPLSRCGSALGRSVPARTSTVRVPAPGLAAQIDGGVHGDAGLLERSDQRRTEFGGEHGDHL